MRGRNRERDRALSLLRDGSVWTTEAFRDQGISVRTLRRIVADGFAENPALGLYRSVGSEPSPWDQWAEVTARQPDCVFCLVSAAARSEEHTSELQSLMRISYAVFCLKKKNSISRASDTCTQQ